MKKAIELDETYWKKLKFNLIFIISAFAIYIGVTKYLFKTPSFNNTDMLNRIDDYEKMQRIKSEYAGKSKLIFKTIDTIKYDINQVQRIDEVKRSISDYKQLYKDNEFHSSYNFCLIGGNLLNVFLEINLEQSTVKKNDTLIQKSLNECKANFKDEH
ncbi:type VI secretion system TssO [Flavobacterium procerum]|uniref:Type VI secretion system TssO n=1 Tax=Flavobacterium procerum TaxID=1455569 RepID=A0ABV6BUH7_9FLAO